VLDSARQLPQTYPSSYLQICEHARKGRCELRIDSRLLYDQYAKQLFGTSNCPNVTGSFLNQGQNPDINRLTINLRHCRMDILGWAVVDSYRSA